MRCVAATPANPRLRPRVNRSITALVLDASRSPFSGANSWISSITTSASCQRSLGAVIMLSMNALM